MGSSFCFWFRATGDAILALCDSVRHIHSTLLLMTFLPFFLCCRLSNFSCRWEIGRAIVVAQGRVGFTRIDRRVGWVVTPVSSGVFGVFPAPSFLSFWPTLFCSVRYCVVVTANGFLPEPLLSLSLSRECPIEHKSRAFDVDV